MRAKLISKLTAVFILILTLGVGTPSQPVEAEINSNSQTAWGLSQRGNASTVSESSLGWAVSQIGNTVYVGGNYLKVSNGSQTGSQSYLAAFDADTGAWQSWFRPNVSNAVFALEPSPDGALFVGGEFSTWNGAQSGGLVKIDPTTGEIWPGWNTQVTGGAAIYDLKIEADGKLYVVGSFTSVSGASGPVSGAVRLNPATGAIDNSWRPQVANGAGVWGVSRSRIQSVVYLAGKFSSVNGGANTAGFVGVNEAGTVVVNNSVLPDNGCAANVAALCDWMYDVEATEYGTLWVAGVEHAMRVLNETQSYALIRQQYTACVPDLNDNCSPGDWFGGDFQEIERVGDRIYASCHCWYDHYSDTQPIIHESPTGTHTTIDTIAAYNPLTGARIESFRPVLSGASGAWGISGNTADGCLWVTGGVATYGPTQRNARNLVRLCDQNGAGPIAQPDPGPPAPTYCTSELNGSTMSIAWPEGSGTTGAVVERRVSAGGSWFWRGVVSPGSNSFSESVPNSGTTYRVSFKYKAGQQSSRTLCGTGGPASPASNCVVTASSASLVEMSWTAGGNASSYVVFRTDNGGIIIQNGAADGTSFTGSATPGHRYSYFVVSVSGDGSHAAPTPCGAVRMAGASASG